MPEIKTASFSLQAKGTISRMLAFACLPHLQIVKRKPIPTGTPSAAQLAQRLKYANCLKDWQDLDPDTKQDYINQAKGYPQTALSLFLHACLMLAVATLQGTVGIYSSIPINVIVRFFTPGTTTETYKAAAPTNTSGVFTITGIPPGTYDVAIKSGGYLSLLVASQVFTEGATTNVNFGTFIGLRGVIVDNDWIISLDQSAFSAGYSKKGACYGYPGNWLMP